MTNSEFEARLYSSSVQLVRIDASNNPTGTASSALIDYRGKRLLLSVEHATGDQKRWAIQLRHDPGKGTALHGVGAMNFLSKGSLADPKKKLDTVDFSYVEVPSSLCAFRQDFDATAAIILNEMPISIHRPSLTDMPAAGENYGFCGMVMAEIGSHPAKTVLGGQVRVYQGLKYLRTDGDAHSTI